MKLKSKSIVKAVLVIIFLTVLPLITPNLLPSELYNAINMLGGVDIGDLLIRTAILGLGMATLIVLKGSFEKTSQKGFVISITWKIFLLILVIFILSIGKVENLGFATLSSGSNGSQNTVIFDLRFIIVLVAAITVLMIVHSIIEYKEKQSISEGKKKKREKN